MTQFEPSIFNETDEIDVETDEIELTPGAELEETSSMALDEVPMLAAAYDVAGRLRTVNQEWEDVLGWKLEDVRGQNLMSPAHPKLDEKGGVREHLWRAEGRWMDFQTRTTKGGKSLAISWLGLRLRDGSRLALGNDIAQRKQAEESLKEREEQFRLMFELVPTGLMMVNLEGWLLRVNEELCKILGYSHQELLLRRWSDLTHPDDPNPSTIIQHAVLNQRVHFRMNIRYQRRDDEIIESMTQGTLVRDAEGKSMYFILQVEDMTEHRRIEAEREALNNFLMDKNARLERFAYTASHDLKNPLTTIRSYLGAIEHSFEKNRLDRIKDDIGRIKKATENMEKLLDEISELSRLDNFTNPHEDIHLAELVQEAIHIFFQPTGRRPVYVMVSAKLPTVHGDRIRLMQLFQLLVDNAVKFMGDQSEPRVEIGTRVDDRGKPVIFIRDNGLGIDPRYHEKIFLLFEQVDPMQGGTGTGLALARTIVERHGGQIWVESEGEEGSGSTFCLTLPGVTRTENRLNETAESLIPEELRH